MCHGFKETLEVGGVDVVIVPIIDHLKRFLHAIVIGIFEFSFHKICFQVESDLLEY